MTARGFFAVSCSQAPRAGALRLDESMCAPRHADHYGAAADDGNVIQLGTRKARRLRSPVRTAARDEGVKLLMQCIGSRATKVELAALFDASPKDVTKWLEGDAPFPAEAFVLVALRRPDLAVEVVVSYVSLLSDACLDTIISRLVAAREDRKAKKPS
jgi:hypothetical protein